MNLRFFLAVSALAVNGACAGSSNPAPGTIAATASAPSIEIELVNTYSDPITGEVKGDPAGTASVDFELEQQPGTTATVFIEFSTDGAGTWQQATIDEDISSITSPANKSGLAPAANEASHYKVTWQIATDLGPGDFSFENAGAGFDAIQLRVVVLGGEPSSPSEEPVEIDLMGFPFSSEESLGTARTNNVAAVVDGSDLFIVGGQSASNSLAGAERGKRIDDIADFTFSPAGILGVARGGMSQTFLPGGALLLAGGEDGSGARTEVELFDPRDDTFNSLAPLNLARVGHASLLLPNGRVCVVGGRSDAVGGTPTSNSYEIFNATTNTWSLGSLTGSYDEPLCVLLSDGRILVAGSLPGSDVIQAEYLSLTGDSQLSSSPAPALLASRRGATATVLVSGDVLIFGGHDLAGNASSPTAELFNTKLGTSTAIPETNPNIPGYVSQGRWNHDAALTANGRLFIVGGRDADIGGVLTRTDYFLPLENTFTPSTLLPEARSGHHVNRVENGYLVISGGLGANDAPIGTTATLIPPSGQDSLPTANIGSLSWSSLTGLVRINYTLFDAEADSARVRIEWTSNPSVLESWRAVTSNSNSSTPQGDGYSDLAASLNGTSHTFSWDATADGVFAQGSPTLVSVRITPIGAAEGPAVQINQSLP